MEKEDIQWVWELSESSADAALIVSALEGDMEEVERLDERWRTVTLPYLNQMPYQAFVVRELERRIAFAEKRLREITDEYNANGKPFKVRRALMEAKLPAVENALESDLAKRGKSLFMAWRPSDVSEIKRMGMEKFVRYNYDRFF